jgi:hypothetical protein
MATIKQKQQLIDRIKHGIKKFSFSIQRYGGETVMGRITPYQYHYWKNREQELTDYLMGFEREEYEKEHKIPEEARFNKDWFENDDVVHICGAPVESTNYLHINESDQHGAPIHNANSSYKMWEPIELSGDNIHKLGIQLEKAECIDVDHPDLVNEYYFWGSTSNKGSWTTESLMDIEGDLDLKKLKIHYKQIEGSDIAYAISYGDGEHLSLQEDSSGSSQQCYVGEGNMDESTMSKKLKKEIARAEAEAPQPDTDDNTKEGWLGEEPQVLTTDEQNFLDVAMAKINKKPSKSKKTKTKVKAKGKKKK